MMIFSPPPTGSSNVEIAKTDRRQAMSSDHKADHLVNRQLRSSIGIRRARNRRLENRYLFRLSVDCSCRRKDEARYACSAHSLQQIQRTADVVAVVALWLLYRLAYQGQRREMQHTVEAHAKHLIQRGFIQQIASMKRAPSGTAWTCPFERLSKTVTSWPASRSWAVITLPMYPAPPVTRSFISRPPRQLLAGMYKIPVA